MSHGRLKRRGTGFTAVPNSFIRDDNLSGDARMLFMLLFSHSENWVFRLPQIGKNLGYGKDRLRKAKNLLIELGYLSISQPKDDKGAVIPGPWEWEISIDPALPISARRKTAQATARLAENRPPLEEQEEENQDKKTISLSDEEQPASERENKNEVGFEAFWTAYPAGHGGSRTAAAKAWDALSTTERKQALRAAKALSAPQTLYPALFLSEGHWRKPVVVKAAPPPRPNDLDQAQIYDQFANAGRLPFWANNLNPKMIRIEGAEIVPLSPIVRPALARDPVARSILSTLNFTLREKQFKRRTAQS